VLVRVLAAVSRASRDTTERMWELELAHTRMRAEMEIERHRALSQMVAGVAHELNTPLGLAHASADLIERRCGTGALAECARGDPTAGAVLTDVAEACGLLRRNVTRAHALVESFKRLSVRQLSDGEERVDVATVVRDAVELFGPSARDAGLDVRIEDRRDGRAAEWTGSPGQLTQVLFNLLSNAERYAYDAGGSVEIVIADSELDGAPAVELTVRDFGRGIAPEDRERVFEPFFTTGRARGGTGLGLSIVHGIVTSAMAGQVDVESALGEGAAVSATLPLKRPATP